MIIGLVPKHIINIHIQSVLPYTVGFFGTVKNGDSILGITFTNACGASHPDKQANDYRTLLWPLLFR